MMNKLLLPLLGCSLLAGALTAQATWTQLAPATAPSGRSGMPGVSDLTGMLVFGGNRQTGGRTNEMWRFDGTAWTDLTPAAGSPTARIDHAATYDISRGRYVLFGGFDGAVKGDTWEWDGASWTQLTPAASPPARRFAQMVYDTLRNHCVLFGGNSAANVPLGDTWTWDGTTWSQLAPAQSPSGRRRFAMAHNLSDGTSLIYGGVDASATSLGDTWSWDGTNWQQIATATTPWGGSSNSQTMTYDVLRNRFVMFGAALTGGAPTPETYEFDGVDWIDRGVGAVSPQARYAQAMAYVLGMDRTYMFGGYTTAGPRFDDTWDYQTDAAATSTAGTSGQGCAGNNGMIPMQNVVSLAWMGDTFQIAVSGLAASSASKVICLNFVTPIQPIPLAILGFPQCQFLADPALAFPLGANDTFTVEVPDLAGNKGLAFFTQAVGVELVPPAIAASDRRDIVIGAR